MEIVKNGGFIPGSARRHHRSNLTKYISKCFAHCLTNILEFLNCQNLDQNSIKKKHIDLSREIEKLNEENRDLNNSINYSKHTIDSIQFRINELKEMDSKISTNLGMP